jgi:hypothetical protein
MLVTSFLEAQHYTITSGQQADVDASVLGDLGVELLHDDRKFIVSTLNAGYTSTPQYLQKAEWRMS